MTQHIIKIVCEATNEIRKVQVDEDKWLGGVIEKVRDLFEICKIGSDEEPNIRLWYVDNHGDAIYVSTSEELRIGLRTAQDLRKSFTIDDVANDDIILAQE
ncbi:MAG: hypothetical protein EZS28_037209, partial [Streblomastix strix]